ncbi:hypothetical protein V6G69_005291, partial [Burkholderia multivorans]
MPRAVAGSEALAVVEVVEVVDADEADAAAAGSGARVAAVPGGKAPAADDR